MIPAGRGGHLGEDLLSIGGCPEEYALDRGIRRGPKPERHFVADPKVVVAGTRPRADVPGRAVMVNGPKGCGLARSGRIAHRPILTLGTGCGDGLDCQVLVRAGAIQDDLGDLTRRIGTANNDEIAAGG
jgi:hypothetical protein